MVTSSAAIMPARAPASIDMLHKVIRPSMDSERTVLCLDVRGRGKPLRCVRQRNRTAREPLQHEEQRGQWASPAVRGRRPCDHAVPTVCATKSIFS